jgi:hypothetical protein
MGFRNILTATNDMNVTEKAYTRLLVGKIIEYAKHTVNISIKSEFIATLIDRTREGMLEIMLTERDEITWNAQILLAVMGIDESKVKAKVLLGYSSNEIKKYTVNHKLASQLSEPKHKKLDRLFIKSGADKVISTL